MKTEPYLIFDGSCAEAMRFYQSVLGGTLEVQTFGDSPAAGDTPPEWSRMVMHARLAAGDVVVMASDSPHEPVVKGNGVWVTVQVTDHAEGKRVFDQLAAQGTVKMAFEKTFWSAGYGMCIDRFGVPWMVNVL